MAESDQRCHVVSFGQGLDPQQAAERVGRRGTVLLLRRALGPPFLVLVEYLAQVSELPRVAIEAPQHPGVKIAEIDVLAKLLKDVPNDGTALAEVQPTQGNLPLAFLPH